jgi:hypothetical protein
MKESRRERKEKGDGAEEGEIFTWHLFMLSMISFNLPMSSPTKSLLLFPLHR